MKSLINGNRLLKDIEEDVCGEVCSKRAECDDDCPLRMALNILEEEVRKSEIKSLSKKDRENDYVW